MKGANWCQVNNLISGLYSSCQRNFLAVLRMDFHVLTDTYSRGTDSYALLVFFFFFFFFSFLFNSSLKDPEASLAAQGFRFGLIASPKGMQRG